MLIKSEKRIMIVALIMGKKLRSVFLWMGKCLLAGTAVGLVLGLFIGNIRLMFSIAMIFSFFTWGSEELVHRSIIRKFDTSSLRNFFLKGLILSLLTALAASLLSMLVIVILFNVPFFTSPNLFFFAIIFNLFITTIIVGFGYAVDFYKETQVRLTAEREAKETALKAELKALKAQIKPHFLFNTLNTIAALTQIDPAKAEKTIEDLAEIYRYILQASEKELIPFEQELGFTETYLRIEKARFGKKLIVNKDVSPEASQTLVPVLITQPIVENAIRHGISEGSKEGEIKIIVRNERNFLEIQVVDNGPGIPAHKLPDVLNMGTGLSNIAQRLIKIYSQENLLQISNIKPSGVRVTMVIPRKS